MKHTIEELLLAERVMAVCADLRQKQADQLFPERNSDSFGKKHAWLKETSSMEFLPQAMELIGSFAAAIKRHQQ